MNRMNQAFFKAYGQSTEQPQANPTGPYSNSRSAPSKQGQPTAGNDPYANGDWYRIEYPGGRVPPPHTDFSLSGQRATPNETQPPQDIQPSDASTIQEQIEQENKIAAAPKPIAQPPATEVEPASQVDHIQTPSPTQAADDWRQGYVSMVSSSIPFPMPTPQLPPSPEMQQPAQDAPTSQAATQVAEENTAAVNEDQQQSTAHHTFEENTTPAAASSEPEQPPVEEKTASQTPETTVVSEALLEKETVTASEPPQNSEVEEVASVEEPAAAQDVKNVESEEVDRETGAEQPPRTIDISGQIKIDRKFRPAWEVNRFHWPAECSQLLASLEPSFAEASHQLLDVVEAGRNVIAITGLKQGEGRTTLALCLARFLAANSASVALVDADFENPDLGYQLGLEDMPGWNESGGNVSLQETAIVSVEDSLTLVPLAKQSSDDKPAAQSLGSLLRQASRLYDLVLVDLGPLPPAEAAVETIDVLRPVDAAIVVCDMRLCDEQQIVEAAERITLAGIHDIMLAETFAPQSTSTAIRSKAA